MVTPRLIKPAAQPLDLTATYAALPRGADGVPTRYDGTPLDVTPAGRADLIDLSEPDTPRPVSQLRGTRDYGQVLHQIRALVAFACFLLAVVVMLLAAVAHRIISVPTGADAVTPLNGRTELQLYIPGPDPAADYYAHVEFADGTERDVQIGSYLIDRPVRIEFAVQAAEESVTSCRIVMDGVRVADQVAESGRTAKCRWNAP